MNVSTCIIHLFWTVKNLMYIYTFKSEVVEAYMRILEDIYHEEHNEGFLPWDC